MITPREDLNLDMSRLLQLVSTRGHNIGAKGELGLTFNYDSRTKVSILKSGIAVVTTRGSEEEALGVYRQFVVDGLSISEDQIGFPSK